jgi:hypothetical protein
VPGRAQAFEAEVLRRTFSILENRKPEIQSRGIRSEPPEIRRTRTPSGYQSELTVYFSDSTGVSDVIEGFLFHKDRQVVDEAEVEAWLNECVEDVLRRRRDSEFRG